MKLLLLVALLLRRVYKKNHNFLTAETVINLIRRAPLILEERESGEIKSN